jgi:dihydroflavonol-4-reductase
MQPSPAFWSGKQVGVTGGSGFLGWHVVQQLVSLGAKVRVLGLSPRRKHPLLRTTDVELIMGDVRDPVAVRSLATNSEVIFHIAGPVAVWGPALRRMREIHFEGTLAVLSAAHATCRVVHTSSVVAVGATRSGEPLTEESPFELATLRVDYVHAKREAEDLALDAARRGQWVCVVNPAYLVGPEDFEPSVMGRLCRRFWKGRLLVAPQGGINLVDVRDVARGHILAAEHGQPGRRYILGGENRTLPDLFGMLSRIGGKTRLPFSLPWWILAVAAGLAECRASLLQREPYPGLQHVRLNRYCWYFSSERAQREIGYHYRPLAETLRDTFAWFKERQRNPASRNVGWELESATAFHSPVPAL